MALLDQNYNLESFLTQRSAEVRAEVRRDCLVNV